MSSAKNPAPIKPTIALDVFEIVDVRVGTGTGRIFAWAMFSWAMRFQASITIATLEPQLRK